VHVDSNPGSFPGFPNLNFNFFSTKPEHHSEMADKDEHNDKYNYALLLALYTLQGIPMGLSASIPFLIQQKVKQMAEVAAVAAAAAEAAGTVMASAAASSASSSSSVSVARMAYNAQAVFALCSWPFSLKLLWAPIVDSIFWKRFGRRKSWLVPVQGLAGLLMITGSEYVETQLGLANVVPPGELGSISEVGSAVTDTARQLATEVASAATPFDVKGVTAFFFALYFLMATQDIAVDGWALTMLSKKNRGKGPVCNSIGQNLGYFLSFVGFLALNDAESSENLWRPLLGLASKPGVGLVSLGGFVRFMGFFMLAVTTFVALFKKEIDKSNPAAVAAAKAAKEKEKDDTSKPTPVLSKETSFISFMLDDEDDDDAELDASQIGLRETYHRLWAVCQLPAVKWLFLILITYRLPTALSDNVKFLKAVEFGLSKQTTALLSPLIVLPLGILVPLIAAKIWKGLPLQQFLTAYKLRVSLVALADMAMLLAVRHLRMQPDTQSQLLFWASVVGSTALQATMQSLQFNAQMTFFASRVDPAIGGSYMTLLNTAANLGGTWPSSVVMYLMGSLTVAPECTKDAAGVEHCAVGRDAYFPIQIGLSVLGFTWLFLLSKRVRMLSDLPEEAWRTHVEEEESSDSTKRNNSSEMETGRSLLVSTNTTGRVEMKGKEKKSR
jgi:PAT family acetyl-CoA transporter-like MFS transporter 1